MPLLLAREKKSQNNVIMPTSYNRNSIEMKPSAIDELILWSNGSDKHVITLLLNE